MSTIGTVWTNSVALPSGTTVHPGDRIATGHSAVAVISSPAKGRVEVRQNSDVTLAEHYVALHEGVVATASAAVTLADYKVKPRGNGRDDPWFAVASRRGRILVAAYRGDVLIAKAGLAPVLVPAGSYAVPAPGPEPKKSRKANRKEKPDERSRNRGAVAAGGLPPKTNEGWKIGPLSHGTSVVLVAGIGAGAAVGAVSAFALGDPSPSPSQ